MYHMTTAIEATAPVPQSPIPNPTPVPVFAGLAVSWRHLVTNSCVCARTGDWARRRRDVSGAVEKPP